MSSGRIAGRRGCVSVHRGLCLVAETQIEGVGSCVRRRAKQKACCSVNKYHKLSSTTKICEDSPINKLQNGIIQLVFKI